MNTNNENKEYELINLEFEYPGINGGVKWAVISDLPMEELMRKYGAELEHYSPVILLSVEQGEAFKEFHKNEHKHDVRDLRHKVPVNYDENLQGYLQPLYDIAPIDNEAVQPEEMELLRVAIESLPAIQQRRLRLYFFEGLSFREIAKIEGVRFSSVAKSVDLAIKKIKKYF